MAFRQRVRQPRADSRHAGIDRIHRCLRPGEYGLKHQEQSRRQQDRPYDRVQYDAVDLERRLRNADTIRSDRPQNSPHFSVVLLDVCGPWWNAVLPARPGGSRNAVEHADEIAGAARPRRNRFHHGDAELMRKPCDIDRESALAREIHHVEREYQWAAEALQGQREPQALPQIVRIANRNDEIRSILHVRGSEERVASDLLVGRARLEAISARQIEQPHAPAGGREKTAFLALDGYTRVVRNLLPAACEQIEEGGLAAVRIANECDERSGDARSLRVHAGSGKTRMHSASIRRSPNRLLPIATAIGLRPSGECATTFTNSPGRNPIAARRRRSPASSTRTGVSMPTTRAGLPIGRSINRIESVSWPLRMRVSASLIPNKAK